MARGNLFSIVVLLVKENGIQGQTKAVGEEFIYDWVQTISEDLRTG